MAPTFRPTPGAKGYQHSCTPVLSSIPLLATLDLIDKADFGVMRAKGIKLTDTLESLLKSSRFYRSSSPPSSSSNSPAAHRGEVGFTILTPSAPWRGTQLSIFILGPEGTMPRVFERCLKMGLVGDERNPNVIRLSPVVLYNTFREVGEAVEILDKALQAETETGAKASAGPGEGVSKRDVLGDQ